jgi:two-component system LytT family response regulator
MTKFTTLIIDDEKIARTRLRRMLADFGELFQVIGEAKNGVEGLEMIPRLKPELIFLDIQMPGKTGFEMLNELEQFPIVVFCTAYEEYALKAFNTMAFDYLVKPVEKERLQLTVDKLSRANSTIGKPQFEALMELVKLQAEPKKLHSIPHKIGDRVILIKPEKICYFAANEKYVDFYTLDGGKYMTELSLKKLEERLPAEFKRVQRGVIVNSNHIKEFRKYFRGKYILILDDVHHTKLETGRNYTEEIKEIIE